jgi:hypothetical protein
MKQVIPLVSLVLLTVSLAACTPEDYLIRQREKYEHANCISRGGDYDRCRVDIAEERRVCLQRWYALPPEERRRINSQKYETRPPEIRACNAIGV